MPKPTKGTGSKVGNRIDLPFKQIVAVQGGHGGQRLSFVDFNLEVTQYCPTAMPLLSTLPLPKQNRQ